MSVVPYDSFVVMVEPKEYTFNEATALDNHFQHRPADLEEASQQALQEHRNAVATLRANGVRVLLVKWGDGEGEHKPDSIFPNNSFSLHAAAPIAVARSRLAGSEEIADAEDQQALAVLYPMSKGRRDELPAKFLDALTTAKKEGLIADIRDLRSLSTAEDGKGAALEGTGAIVFGLAGDAAFVSCSQRADATLSETVLRDEFGLAGPTEAFLFTSVDKDGNPVYHTNVVGWSGTRAAAWCFDAMTFRHPEDKEAMLAYYAKRDIPVLHLTKEEMYGMAGNAIEVSVNGAPRVVMSETAWQSLSAEKKAQLVEVYEGEANVIRVTIPTIESVGGGSARCLMAESRLPPKVVSRLTELML